MYSNQLDSYVNHSLISMVCAPFVGNAIISEVSAQKYMYINIIMLTSFLSKSCQLQNCLMSSAHLIATAVYGIKSHI
jgi:hypothetical protein